MRSAESIKKRVSTFILFIILSAPVANAQQPIGILLLFSYEPVYPAAQLLTEHLNQSLQEEIDTPFQLHIEYLDADLGASDQYLNDYRQLLLTKQQQNADYDVVIAAGNSALEFAARERKK